MLASFNEIHKTKVALLAEGVDRNTYIRICLTQSRRSPSSRRAWIEMSRAAWTICSRHVALLAEGVDRNTKELYMSKAEIVALLAEGVDRNHNIGEELIALDGRPPRGGRG